MRAAVIERAGAPVRIEELSLDGPREGEVQVRMLGSGVCHSDLHVRDGDWERPGPIVLGHEGAGVVEAVGPGVDVPHVGDLVALSWYAPCLVCRECEAGRQWLCTGSPSLRHRMNDGTTRLHRGDGSDVLAYLSIGTFAEAQVVPATAAVTMPDGITPETAALIGCCVSTGVGAALKTAALRAGATVVVFGLGGVGLSVLMGARIAQAGKIVAVDRVQAKLDLATELGATPPTADRMSPSRRSGSRRRSSRRSRSCRQVARRCSLA
jgi:S-(hydroxymethyl)glutathione dehydrogenase/alcohol dehydrogenase